jgi:cell fate regulator YaaT (PSP1 superfamily)
MRIAAVCLSERSFAKYYDPNGIEIKAGDFCVVEDKQVTETVGRVSMFESRSGAQLRHAELPRVLRLASDKEIEEWGGMREREIVAMELCKSKSRELKLDMKVSTVRFDNKQNRVIFQFTADQRVDFRQLVRELASTLKARIELWQIGVRDESSAIHGFGACGMQLCCATWIKEFAPVSIRQAKDQDLVLSPAKLSGLCGRLRCCLSYEHKHYKEASKNAPYPGAVCRCHGLDDDLVVLSRSLLSRTFEARNSEGTTLLASFDDVEAITGKIPPSTLRQYLMTRSASAIAIGGARETEAASKEAKPAETPAAPQPAPQKPKERVSSPSASSDGSKPLVVSADAEQGAAAKPKEDGDKSSRSRRRRRKPRNRQRAETAQGGERKRADQKPAENSQPAAQRASQAKEGEPVSKSSGRRRRGPRRRRRPSQSKPSE